MNELRSIDLRPRQETPMNDVDPNTLMQVRLDHGVAWHVAISSAVLLHRRPLRAGDATVTEARLRMRMLNSAPVIDFVSLVAAFRSAGVDLLVPAHSRWGIGHDWELVIQSSERGIPLGSVVLVGSFDELKAALP